MVVVVTLVVTSVRVAVMRVRTNTNSHTGILFNRPSNAPMSADNPDT